MICSSSPYRFRRPDKCAATPPTATLRAATGGGIVFWLLVLVLAGISFAGLTVINPNNAKVLTLFGVYKGTIKKPGFWWVNPLTSRRHISLRVRHFESGRLKVN